MSPPARTAATSAPLSNNALQQSSRRLCARYARFYFISLQQSASVIRTNQFTVKRLDGLSALVARRNAVSTEIAAILGRPAQLGHLGEFVASVLFDIDLAPSANNKGFDGRFTQGLLAGKSVDVKTYAKREGIIDLRMQDLPDYYLILSGPRAPAASSKGQDRPWVIDGIHLFDAQMLVESLLSRSLKVGIAASVAAAYWVAAEVYPSPTCKLLEVRDDQRVWLESFGRIRAGV